jgi:hypothetical protein
MIPGSTALMRMEPRHRGDVHDRAPAAVDHGAARRLREEEDAGEVHVDDAAPEVLGELQQRPQLHDGGGVHQHVDAAEAFDHPGDRGFDVGGAGDVAAVRHHGTAARLEVGHRAGERIRLDVEQRQVGALRAEQLGAGPAHALRPADHQDGAPLEPAHAPTYSPT